MSNRILGWLRRHDPEFYALHKAIKCAVVVPAGLAIGSATANGQLALFASFGGIAFLLFADFPGNRAARLGAYLALTAEGLVLIMLGTLVSTVGWLAVVGMAVVGFGVLFAGVLSAAAAGATRAALLAFILPATVPAPPAEIASRWAGWLLAAVLAIPVALLVWPPRDHDRLRTSAAGACAALSNLLQARASAPVPGGAALAPAADGTVGARLARHDAPDGDPDAATRAAILAFRRQFRSTTFRPVGLTTGSRLLMQLTDRLEWLMSVIRRIPANSSDHWSAELVHLVRSCAEVLRVSAELLASTPHRPSFRARQQLTDALRELERLQARTGDFLVVVAGSGVTAADQVQAGSVMPALAHELVYTTRLAGLTVAVSAAADARPLVDRLLGRKAPGAADGALVAAHRIVAGHITRRSVWFQNSLRGALGLSIAVALAEITQVAHGFWIVLGAMSVLRTTALTTGSTAVRALGGTLIGFVAGAVIMLVVGTTPWHLWLLLPIAVLFAAYLPEAVSFAAGQVGFTVLVVILFNIIVPTGWTVGLVRVEDVALGCVAGLISGVMLWPRGAAAAIHRALAEHYRRSAEALVTATERLAGRPTADGSTLDGVMAEAKYAGIRLDDAFREYLFERGTKSVPVVALTTVSNGANRVRLAAEAIAAMTVPPGVTTRVPGTVVPAVEPAPSSPDPAGARVGGTDPVDQAGATLTDSATTAGNWFQRLAEVLARRTRPAAPLTVVGPVTAEEGVITAIRATPGCLDDERTAGRATALWAASLYVDGVTRLQTRLVGSVTDLFAQATAGEPGMLGSGRVDDGVAAGSTA